MSLVLPRVLLLLLPLLQLLQLLPSTCAGFDSCVVCDCKWMSGSKGADCSNRRLTAIPEQLSEDVQILELRNNSLHYVVQNAFDSVGLKNLKKIVLRNCSLENVDKNGFKGLTIVIEIDLSENYIKYLHPDTFKETSKLRIVNLNHNQIENLEAKLFSNMVFLQKIELKHNKIHKVDINTLFNLPFLKIFDLDDNKLTHMELETVSNFNLTSLGLRENFWKCDCKLQKFRDWVIDKNLYTFPTDCASPDRLRGKDWTILESDDFACVPNVMFPPLHTTIQHGLGDNVTISCKVHGNPAPQIAWELNSRPLEHLPRRQGDAIVVANGGKENVRWSNLTLINFKYNDRGEYACIGRNRAGEDKRPITLAFSRTAGGGAAGGGTDIITIVVAVVVGTIVLLVITAIICFCFCRRNDMKRHLKGDMHSSNGEALIEGSVIPEMEKSLITTVNPVTKPPRRYDAPPSVMSGATEMSELNKTLLDSDSVFAPNEDESRSMDFADSHRPKLSSRDTLNSELSRSEQRTYPPDLLSFPARGGQASPAASSASTAPDSSRLPPQSPAHSPIYSTNPNVFRTLPYSRSQSPFPSPVCPPVVTPRQGYVTIPRRPRIPSWASNASAATNKTLPVTEYVEPVYDNLGLRTTADGSSVLSLNKAGLEQQFSPGMRGRPLPATPGSYQGPLPVVYTPIEEADRAPSPAPSTPYSATLPRINGNSLHLQLSPKSPEEMNKPRMRPRNIPETNSLKRINNNNPTSPLGNGRIFDSPAANDVLGKSVKVPPRPPPKPKKKSPSESNGPLFEDEGEDGTEV